jgi:hypothetical protein
MVPFSTEIEYQARRSWGFLCLIFGRYLLDTTFSTEWAYSQKMQAALIALELRGLREERRGASVNR